MQSHDEVPGLWAHENPAEHCFFEEKGLLDEDDYGIDEVAGLREELRTRDLTDNEKSYLAGPWRTELTEKEKTHLP